MAFEHYTRSGTKMLRCGYTTGTCAALAAAAAVQILLTGRAPETVSLMTGKGIPVEVAVENYGMDVEGPAAGRTQDRVPTGDGHAARGAGELPSHAARGAGELPSHAARGAGELPSHAAGGAGELPSHAARGAGELPSAAWAAIPKDAGDDADVTDGLLIRADVRRDCRPGIHIDGGAGVGRVTRPGLDQPVGNAAINSGPRRMIKEAVRNVCESLGFALEEMAAEDASGQTSAARGPVPAAPEGSGGGFLVTISVPEGEAAARKTFNPKLGIEGGISILGTTGIVEPMSEQALVDTIEVELKQLAMNTRDLILTPGNYGSEYIAGHDLDELGVPVLKFSNFLGETLDMIAGQEIETVLLVAHAGKLSKVAAAIMNTHSRYADGRNEIFCAHAAVCGGSTSLCRELMAAATTDACIDLLDGEGLREQVIGSILRAVQDKLEHRTGGKFRIGALMFSNVHGLLGMTEKGAAILQEWEERV